MTLGAVYGSGRASVAPASAVDACITYNSAIYNATACTVGTGGTDSTAAGNTFFATLAYAVRTWTGGSVINCVSDLTQELDSLRNTDASQVTELVKIIYANGYNVIISTSAAVDPKTATWTQDLTYTNCWGTPAAWLAGSAQVTRVLRTDVNDSYGYSTQLRQYTALSDLDAGGTGWYWDDTAKQLWVALGGSSVQANRSILKCMFLSTAGFARVIALGSVLAFDGVRFEGVTLQTNDAGGRRPELWLNNCTQLWSYVKGWDAVVAGWFIETNSMCYASRADGRNAYAPSVTGQGLILTANSYYVNTGDLHVFPPDGTLQGISAHGGSHNVSWGCGFYGNDGSGVGDGIINGYNDITWLVGCDIGPQQSTVGNLIFGAAVPTTGTRKVYLDTCRSTKFGADDLEILTAATVYGYNTELPVVTGGSVTAYTPTSPP